MFNLDFVNEMEGKMDVLCKEEKLLLVSGRFLSLRHLATFYTFPAWKGQRVFQNNSFALFHKHLAHLRAITILQIDEMKMLFQLPKTRYQVKINEE